MSERVVWSADEREFESIVRAGRESGWLLSDCEFAIEASASDVEIRMHSVGGDRTRRYAKNAPWLLQFLREVAHREWLLASSVDVTDR